MKRTTCVLMLLLTTTTSGCTKSLLNTEGLQTMLTPVSAEQRVVERFRDALVEENEPALRRISSTKFEALALNSEDVLSDLRMMHLPKGDLTVSDIKKISDSEKLATVKEKKGGRYQFLLTLDEAKGYWTVEDVMVRRQNTAGQMTKSTTEVMGLLQTVRSFLKVWTSGDQPSILAMTSPQLKKTMQGLPREWVRALTRQIASSYEEGMARTPDATLNEDDAIVKLPARNGHLLMTLVRDSEEWLVDDVEFQSHRDDNRPGSVKRQADAIHAVTSFLKAYSDSDHEKLKYVTESKFYNSSLSLGNLSMIPLPSAEAAPDEFVIRAYGQQLTFMLPSGQQVVRVDMREQVSDIPEAARNRFLAQQDNQSRFLVQEVTVYDKGSKQRRSLSAVFTAPARATLFLKALKARDRDSLQYLSTNRFSQTVWQRLQGQLVSQLPIPDFYDADVRLVNSHSIGNRTELEFENSSGQVLDCQLVVENGILKIDDVRYPTRRGGVASLKSELQLAAPVIEFANAWMLSDSELLQKASSTDFNRFVWSHLDRVPAQFSELPFLLRSQDVATTVTQERATMKLGQPDGSEATVRLLVEHGHWVVDEVQLQPQAGPVVAVRQSLRQKIADQMVIGDSGDQIAESSFSTTTPPQAVDLTMPNNSAESTLMTAQIGGDFAANSSDIVQTGHLETEPKTESTASNVISQAVYRQPEPKSAQSNSTVRFADYARVVSDQQQPTSPRRPTSVTPLQNSGGQLGLPKNLQRPRNGDSRFQFVNEAPTAKTAVPASRAASSLSKQTTKDYWNPELKQPADFPIAIPES